MTRHHIRLTGNVVSGAVSLTSAQPIIDAAKALLAAGASPDDVLHVDAGEVNIAPMTLASVLRSRPTPGRTEMMRTMLGLPPTR